MRLRDAFLRDFGIDLPLGEGSGKRSDPFVVLADNMPELSRTVEVTLALFQRGKGFAREEDIFWRILRRDLHHEANELLFQLSVQKLILSRTEATDEKASYFFKAPHLILDSVPKPYLIHLDPKVGVSFPYKISGLEYSVYRDFEQDRPGLGYSIGYSAPKVEATLYVYSTKPNASVAENIRDEVLKTLTVHKTDCSRVEPFEIKNCFGPCAQAVEMHLSPEKRSLIIVDQFKGKLLKWRITWLNDERRDVVEDFVTQSGRLFIPIEQQTTH
jgi:hypothetical protein